MPYVVIEGMDGAGTTTHSELLYRKLLHTHEVAGFHEPTAGPIGTLVRDYFEGKLGGLPSWRTMLHLFQADREMFVEDVLKPGLARGLVMISDRCWLSGLIYQQVQAKLEAEARGENGEAEALCAVKLIRQITEHLPYPDLVIILEVPWEVSRERKNRLVGEGDLFEKKKAFGKAVFEKYATVSGPNIVRIDANRDKQLVETSVFSAVTEIL